MELPRGTLLLLLTMLALAATGHCCSCTNNKRTEECVFDGETCRCKSIGSNVTVNCGTLSSKCLLMKAEVFGAKRGGRRARPDTAFVDNDGIYDPECDDQGKFKAKQCNGTSTCWCVNTAGVRRTDKGDKNINCNEVVRTSWIMIEMKHLEKQTNLDKATVERVFEDELSNRYHLNRKHINIEYENPAIFIELKQNASEKSLTDVDIADVAYYFEKDVKEDPVIKGENLNIIVSGEPLKLDGVVIYYIDEKAPEFSMKQLTAGVIAVIVVVVLAVVAGILVLVFTRRKRGKYEKAEVKEMNEMKKELNS